MKFSGREKVAKLRKLFATVRPEPTQQASRIVAMQRDIVLPSKLGVILVVLYFLFYSGWFYDTPTTRSVVQEMLRNYFLIYILCNLAGGVFFALWRRLPPGLFQWLAFTMGLLDGLLVSGLIIVTGGFDSTLFWVLPGLIVLNAFSIPLAMPQIVLNLLLSAFYLTAGLSAPHIGKEEILISASARNPSPTHVTNQPTTLHTSKPVSTLSDIEMPAEEMATEDFMLRVAVLWLLTICCYGAQLLLERQRRAVEEAREFAARENQLHSAGRLAAEFAHQIKNPLAAINNSAYMLRRSLPESSGSAGQQLEIIEEEVQRADRAITQIMGYAQLSEGRVEKLDVIETLNDVIEQIYPAAASTEIRLERNFAPHFPPLLMQRSHLSEILVNILVNAREAIENKGTVILYARCLADLAVEISVTDDGPGIAPDKLERIFEAYFTTKKRGTGLGLSIVKHNVELYGGTVRVESELGKGAKFTVVFPAKALTKPFAK